MRRLLSAACGATLLLAGLAVVYKQFTGPLVVHVFALGGLLVMAGAAWMFMDIAGHEDGRR